MKDGPGVSGRVGNEVLCTCTGARSYSKAAKDSGQGTGLGNLDARPPPSPGKSLQVSDSPFTPVKRASENPTLALGLRQR